MAHTNGQQLPVITLQILPDGGLRAGCNINNRIMILGMIEAGKHALMQQLDEQAKQKVVVPPPNIAGHNLRGSGI